MTRVDFASRLGPTNATPTLRNAFTTDEGENYKTTSRGLSALLRRGVLVILGYDAKVFQSAQIFYR
jgi:hypothetical protein